MFEEEELPQLVEIKKKRKEIGETSKGADDKNKQKPKPQLSNLFQGQDIAKSSLSMNQNVSNQKDKIAEQKETSPLKTMEESGKKFKKYQEPSLKHKTEAKEVENEKEKQNEKSKALIAEMLNKISIKNVSQEIYPVSNQTISNLTKELDAQIDDLRNQVQKKQSSLHSYENNQHLKKEVETLKKTINQCMTIKELYCEKLNFRNKVAQLQARIIDLKHQNRDLTVKVSRGIEKTNTHMHNLPCEKEKEYKEKYIKCKQELTQERQMRQNLQKNMQNIIKDFNRLYEQADVARKIVTNKLKQIEHREKQLLLSHREEEQRRSTTQLNNSSSQNKKSFYLQTDNKKSLNVRGGEDSDVPVSTKAKKSEVPSKITNTKTKKKQKEKEQLNPKEHTSPDLQQQIIKMRNDQNLLFKLHRKQ